MKARRAALAFAVALLCSAGASADPLAEARQKDGWVNYAVPLAGDQAPCCLENWRRGDAVNRGCSLERRGRHGIYGTFDDGGKRKPVGPKPELSLFLKFERGAVEHLLVVGTDCPVEVGSAKVRALEGVTPAASAALLAALADANRDLEDEAWNALAMHAEVGVDALLAVARDKGRTPKARRQALFWLGSSHDPRAIAEIESILKR
jgi:hypothetical protein